jgi:N-acylmannosamine kinase
MTTLAIDIGGTKLAAALIDTQHRVLEKQTLPTPASKTPAALTEALSALVAPFAPGPAGSSRLHGHYWSRRTDGVKPG